jgi:hypothetical protein
MSDDPLDQVNRFVIVVLALLVATASLLVIVLAWGAPDGSIDRVTDFAGYLEDHNSRDGKLIVTLGAAVVGLLMLTLLFVELTPSPAQQMRVRNVGAGEARITTAQIAERINAEVGGLADVAECVATVVARGRRIEVILDLHLAPQADLSRAADEACRRAHALVEERLGIELAARPRARLHYRELRLGDRGAGEASNEQSHAHVPRSSTGWEAPRPAPSAPAADVEGTLVEEPRDQRSNHDTSQEAQA